VFLFAHDLFGLAEAGHYVNTVQALTPVTLYRLDIQTLSDAFRQDAELQLRFLCKAVHELREAQHHAIMISRRHASARVAMLLRQLEHNNEVPSNGEGISIPMSRSDMADYLGLSLEAVVRACRRLEQQGIIEFPDRHHAQILDRRRFTALASAA
jgi:CRP/FNR family transcriptional regulator